MEDKKPDYMVEFDRFWRELVTDDQGNLDVDKVARELADYRLTMDNASEVYSELAGFSKPNTAARHVIDYAERQFGERYADDLLVEVGRIDGEITREDIAEIANGWSDGASERFAQRQPA